MSEAGFIASLRANPTDDAVRLVHADWLEEQGDPRAEFLRLECRVLKLSLADKPNRLRTRLRRLQQALDPDWVALVRRLPLPDAIEAALSELQSLLAGINYLVSFGIDRLPGIPDAPPERYISAALGPTAVIAGIQPVEGDGLLADVEGCIQYRGDDGHGPYPSSLRSRVFKQRLRRVLGYMEQSVGEARTVARVSLREGHPFYPVMWDFAYVIVKPRCAVVFVGASSD
jgi:uncharacterized protein (TIGR02996 family)